MDRRLTPFSGRIGLLSLQGQMDVPLTEGTPARIAAPLAFLRASPGGAVDRQLLHGDAVTVIDRQGDSAFVQAEKDGYCGWLALTDLAPPYAPTHRIRLPASHVYAAPKVQAQPVMPLYLNGKVAVLEEEGPWARTALGFIPAPALAPLDQPAADPVAVAESLLHAPYLWAGNSVAGVDCSGLVQLAFHAAGRTMPGDSDLQSTIGSALPENAALQRGDLIFWKGHVALMTAPDRLIHANGYTMSVAYEPLSDAMARIAAHYGGQPVARRRP